jgi:hypothetical protein
LGQGSTLKLRIMDDVAINIDGEPEWQKAPCEVSITRWGSISILRKSKDEDDADEKDKKKKKESSRPTRKVHIGSKRIAKRRRPTAHKAKTNVKPSWEQDSKFSLGGFLLYMLTGRV